MSKTQLSDTDLINEMVRNFGENQATLQMLVDKVNLESKTNLDPIAQSKLKLLRRSILIEDLKDQDKKIEMISNVLNEICSPIQLPNA